MNDLNLAFQFEPRGYCLRFGNLKDDQNAIGMAVYENYGDLTIKEMFQDIAEKHAPNSNMDLWQSSPNIIEYVEDVVSDKLVDLQDFNLMSAFRMAHIEYYKTVLKENFEEIMFNSIIHRINKFLRTLSIEEQERIQFSVHYEFIDIKIETFDENMPYSDLIGLAEFVIQTLQEDLRDE